MVAPGMRASACARSRLRHLEAQARQRGAEGVEGRFEVGLARPAQVADSEDLAGQLGLTQ